MYVEPKGPDTYSYSYLAAKFKKFHIFYYNNQLLYLQVAANIVCFWAVEHDGQIYLYCGGCRLLLLTKFEFCVLTVLCKRSLVQYEAVDIETFLKCHWIEVCDIQIVANIKYWNIYTTFGSTTDWTYWELQFMAIPPPNLYFIATESTWLIVTAGIGEGTLESGSC